LILQQLFKGARQCPAFPGAHSQPQSFVRIRKNAFPGVCARKLLATMNKKYNSHRRLEPGKNQAVILFLTLSLFFPSALFGIGFRIPNQDAEAIARGNAFAATADNPSAIYYNPAGITQLPGQNLQVGDLNYFGINTHYDAPGGHSADTKFEVVPVPQIYYTLSPKNMPLSFGLGVYAPFGLGVVWPQDSGFRSIAIESRLQYLTANPVVAWKILPSLSIAAGPTLNYSEIKFTRGLATSTDFFKYDATGFGAGFNAGALWQPIRQLSFGANYRSATTIEYGGISHYNPTPGPSSAQTRARIPYPQIASGGISYRPTANWNLEADVDWSNWHPLNTVVLHGTKKIFGADLPLQLNWHDSYFYEVGATRYLKNGWSVSAGYFYCTDTASPKFFTPAIPDTNLHVGSIGVTHKGEHWNWAVAGQIITGPARSIKNSQPNPFTGESANGSYQLFLPTLTVSVGYHF
jgi:long-chain fatty acid transport protein